MRATRRVFSKLGIDFEVDFNDVAERLDAPAQDLLAVGLGADSFAVAAWKQEL